MKKISLVVLALLAVMVVAGCSKKDDGKTKLTVTSNFSKTNINTKNLEDMAKSFSEKNPEITVEVQVLSEYESSMKTKMAANDLPDLFTTHGWSSTRYYEFLEPLNKMEWFDKLNPLIKENITAKDDNVYVLPMDTDVAGIVFNENVLSDVGVEPFNIKTWDDFLVACEKIKASGKTAIHLGGTKDNWTIGNAVDWIANPVLITDEKNNDQKALLDGTFDWEKFTPVYELMNTFVKNEYLNSDVLEAGYTDAIAAFANNEVGFGFYSNEAFEQARQINPDVKMGYIPIPAYHEGDTPTVLSGEKLAVGVWKDSPHKEEAIKFLNFLAEPENINKVSTSNGNPTGLVGESYGGDLGPLQLYHDNVKELRAFGYFDRAYLPSGMWDSLVKAGETILNQSGSKNELLEKLDSDYQKLSKQQSAK